MICVKIKKIKRRYLWEPFVPGKSEYTMVFDRAKSEVRLDLDRELNRLVCEACEKRGLRKSRF